MPETTVIDTFIARSGTTQAPPARPARCPRIPVPARGTLQTVAQGAKTRKTTNTNGHRLRPGYRDGERVSDHTWDTNGGTQTAFTINFGPAKPLAPGGRRAGRLGFSVSFGGCVFSPCETLTCDAFPALWP